jgi:hypothetical protein
MNTNVKGNEFPELEGMSSYIGTKISGAKPMSRLEYNEFRGWDLPADEDGSDAGYIVQYTDGYISWSPAAQFEDAYRKTEDMNFGLAVEAMKKGLKVQRKGWNGKGMWLILVPGSPSVRPVAGTPYSNAGIEEPTNINAHVDMYTAQGDMQPGWLASQTDMLADDWQVAA